MSAETDVHGSIEERLVVLEPAGDGFENRSSAEGVLRTLAEEGNVDAKEAIAFLLGQRSKRSTR